MKCGQEKQKPVSVLDYNKNMGGVDLKDQLLHPFLLERKKMTKWYIVQEITQYYSSKLYGNMPRKFRTDQNRPFEIQSRTGTGTTY